MDARDVAYSADGAHMLGYLAMPSGGACGPAVLVAHEAPGLTGHAKDVARRLAALGYVAFAMDYHGGGGPVPLEEAQARLRAWIADSAGIRLRARAALDVLLAQPGVDAGRVAAIGFCYGGAAVIELAQTGANLQAVIGFHPGLRWDRPQDAVNICGKVLMLIGADDPFAPPDQRAAFERRMTDAHVDWRMILYGGVQHSFTNPDAAAADIPGIVYDAQTDRRSWRAMLDLFGETIGVP